MKLLYSLLFFIITNSIFSQEINQFDAEGKRHGVWKKNFEGTNVLRYEGAFSHGKEIGLFKFYKKINNKAVLTATKAFNESNNVSQVKFLASNGKVISEGQMDDKIFIGTWKYYQKNSDELLILEHFNNSGKLEGERFVYYENGQIAEKQFYKNGLLDDTYIGYSDNNVVLKQMFYVYGELHGPAKFYNPKGELMSEGHYKRDKKHGVWKFYENGKLVEEKDFTYKPKFIKKTP